MSNACKLLKILSFFFFVVGILSAGMGATALFAGSAAGDITGAMIVSCVVVIVLGVVEIVTAVFGIRAANNPAKAGVVWIWSIVCLACSVISLLLSLPLSLPLLGGTGSSIPDFTGLIVSIIYFVLANRVKKEGMDRLS